MQASNRPPWPKLFKGFTYVIGLLYKQNDLSEEINQDGRKIIFGVFILKGIKK